MDEGTGDSFQRETKYHRGRMPKGGQGLPIRPSLYKEYPKAKSIELPSMETIKRIDFDRILRLRKSIRGFSSKPVTKQQLSYLLLTSTGIHRREKGYEFRIVPSAGALYPIETYILANKVSDLEMGIYHYSVKSHTLDEVRLGDFREDVSFAALGQRMCSRAAIIFLWTAIFNRSKWKYKQRAYRYIYIEAGHIAQNLAISAINLGLGTCQIGAFYDDELNDLLDIDGKNESIIYMSVVGYPI